MTSGLIYSVTAISKCLCTSMKSATIKRRQLIQGASGKMNGWQITNCTKQWWQRKWCVCEIRTIFRLTSLFFSINFSELTIFKWISFTCKLPCSTLWVRVVMAIIKFLFGLREFWGHWQSNKQSNNSYILKKIILDRNDSTDMKTFWNVI